MRRWTKAETRALISIAGFLAVLFVLARLALPSRAAQTVFIAGATLAVSALVLWGLRQIRGWLELERSQTQAIAAIHALLPLRAPLPSLTGWAITPRCLAEALHAVKLARAAAPRERPLQVLECGSGASTLAIGYSLEQLGGGVIVSLDHDAQYAALTVENAALHGLETHVRVVYAPLVEQTIDGDRFPWYELSGIDREQRFDLLLVDGPPEATRPLARYPAFPLLSASLADEAYILADDTAREDERRMIEAWLAQADGQLTVHAACHEGRGYTLLRFRRR